MLAMLCTQCHGDIVITIGSTTCGNGVVEAGEDCDCGTEDYCNEYESCCDKANCVFKSSDFACRNTSDTFHRSCDLPEYCNGISSVCPEDSYKRNGMECSNENEPSYCYSGNCRTHTSQCHHYWGDESKSADGYCYKYLNVVGNKYGNCGKDGNSGYKECKTEDRYCGKLFCDQSPQTEPRQDATYVVYTLTHENGDSALSFTCVSVNISFGGTKIDPGLVYDGTVCEEDSVCIGQQCVKFNTREDSKCPGVGGVECSGNGMCDNNKKCHCNYDFYSDKETCSGEGENVPEEVDSGGYKLKDVSVYWLVAVSFLILIFL